MLIVICWGFNSTNLNTLISALVEAKAHVMPTCRFCLIDNGLLV